jgi:hypothetical protein
MVALGCSSHAGDNCARQYGVLWVITWRMIARSFVGDEVNGRNGLTLRVCYDGRGVLVGEPLSKLAGELVDTGDRGRVEFTVTPGGLAGLPVVAEALGGVV